MRPTRWLFVALALLFASPAAAVTTELGIIGGFAFTNLRTEGSSDGMDGRASFAAGGVVDLDFDNKWGLRIEPTWMSKGSKSTHRNAYWGSVDGAVFKIDCIDVPVLARYDLADSPSHAYLMGGLGVSFATSQTAELTFGDNHEDVDFGDIFNPVDVTLDFGLGVNIPMSKNRMTLDGRTAIGLVDINDGGTVTFNGSPLDVPGTSTKTLDFRLMLTYLFPTSAK